MLHKKYVKHVVKISPENNTCIKCDILNGEGIDHDSRICIKCQSINPSNGECITSCPEGTNLNTENNI